MWNWKKRPRSKSPPAPLFQRGERERGFTLLEIMIAVAILASAFLALLSGQGSAFLASERAERLTVATNLARQKMAETEMKVEADIAKGKFPEEEEENGVFDEPFEDFRWKVTLKKVEIPVPEQPASDEPQGAEGSVGVQGYIQTVMKEISEAVREIQLTVFWGDKNKPEKDQPHLTLTMHMVKMK